MREFDPKLYEQWRGEISKQADHNRYLESAPYRVPGRVTLRGQIAGLVALVAVLAVAGYALYLHEPWIAGFLAGFNIVGVIAIFATGSGPTRDGKSDRRE
ncbi:MAG: hypothetical protein FWD74_12625 [Actinomycetia bacterium]|nr:hypothetical protein [Actinomycetes bacterium]